MHSSHSVCEWIVEDKCMSCLFQQYQRMSIEALFAKEIRKVDVADAIATFGVFAPYAPTDRMRSVFGNSGLENVTPVARLQVEEEYDLCVLKAIRVRTAREATIGLGMAEERQRGPMTLTQEGSSSSMPVSGTATTITTAPGAKENKSRRDTGNFSRGGVTEYPRQQLDFTTLESRFELEHQRPHPLKALCLMGFSTASSSSTSSHSRSWEMVARTLAKLCLYGVKFPNKVVTRKFWERLQGFEGLKSPNSRLLVPQHLRCASSKTMDRQYAMFLFAMTPSLKNLKLAYGCMTNETAAGIRHEFRHMYVDTCHQEYLSRF
ncbi:MAG: hypothetical protein J3R72DRAFT_505775 [Linnemannia gamsii]|nr:MAG: hypothetical protein J3R72DRAFT_505775 [Linnemannia gamsii]